MNDESSGISTDINLSLDKLTNNVAICNLLERSEKHLSDKTQSIEMKFAPFEIKTLKLSGREIKTAIYNAVSLAVINNKKVTKQDILKEMQQINKQRNILKR